MNGERVILGPNDVERIANRICQLENELRYCIEVIDANLDVKHDARIRYAKTLLPEINSQSPTPEDKR
jgi:hypothetical protein